MQQQVPYQAPDFALMDSQGQLRKLADFAGRWLVIYFYPKDNTPGCTAQACSIRDEERALLDLGVTVIGISADSMTALENFASRQDLNFPLASDPEKEVLTTWGAFGEKKNYGRVFQGIIRSTVVLDPSGTVTHALYNVKATGHVARLRKLLGLDQ